MIDTSWPDYPVSCAKSRGLLADGHKAFAGNADHIDLDWGRVYGPEWAILSKATPMSTVFAVGSPIAVYPKGQLIA